MSLGGTILTITFVFALYITIRSIYRLFLSPVAQIPGPKLAAVSRLYELYFDLAQGGRLPWKIQELHDEYGPIVRIGPNEVHVADPQYAAHHFNTRANKYGPHRNRFGFPEATSETAEADLHKHRAHALAPAFSRKAVVDLEPLIKAQVSKVCQRLSELRHTQRSKGESSVIDLRKLFLCMTTDTLTTFGFGFSFDLLDDPDLAAPWRQALDDALRNVQMMKHFPILWELLRRPAVSDWLVRAKPGLAVTIDFQNRNKQIAWETVSRYSLGENNEEKITLAGHESKGKTSSETTVPKTVFEQLLSSDLPEKEKSYDRLWQEASSLMGAGTETVANMLSYTFVQLLSNPTSLSKLREELESRILDPSPASLPSWTELEQFPYLSAVICEGLRMSTSVVHRMLRVLPAETEVCGYVLPKGTVVGMSIPILHHDATVWPDPYKWMPERFLGPEGKGKKDIYSFSKGPRACTGIYFAYAQLYLTLAAVVRQFRLELYETTIRAVEPYYDGVVALTRHDSKGARVVVL
ncbi:Trichodiene oxygenase [Cercospora beticola]|uniref:Trichodiene oxygenase n=1 Tax=Cercospora beticola TaxID=122368 RepID=A0A2G5HH86_CERBT|nr:Trichodiene oxygenase [Cercospora beticola]PIA91898.1 Trichodiene oxygenase [Cercospora beticola]WPB06535.1 hypothetical protein RHO25_011192 [Cercospora beticola]